MFKSSRKISEVLLGSAFMMKEFIFIQYPLYGQKATQAENHLGADSVQNKRLSKGRNDTDTLKGYIDALKSKKTSPSTKEQIIIKLFELRIKPQLVQIPEFNFTERPVSDSQEKSLSQNAKIDLEIIDRYITLYPLDPQVPRIKFLASAILGNQRSIDLAIEAMHRLIAEYPDASESKQAISIILEAHRVRKRYDRLTDAAMQFLKQPLVARDAAFRSRLLSVLRDGLWDWAQKLKSEESPQAASVFVRFQDFFPNDQWADQALAQAADLYWAQGYGSGILSVGTKLITAYLQSPYRQSMLLKVANVYIQQTQFENAAEAYGLYARDYPKDPQSPELLLKGIKFYDYTENLDGARLLSQSFLQLYPIHPDAVRVELGVAENLESMQDFEEAIQVFKNVADRYRDSYPEEAMYAQVKYALILLHHIQSHQGRALLSSLEPVVMNAPKLYRAKEALAKQKIVDNRTLMRNVLDVANLRYETYAEFDQSHTELLKKVSAIQAVYLQIIEIGDASTKGESFLELGNLYERLAKVYSKGFKNLKLSGKDRERFKEQREEVLNLCRNQMTSSWKEGYRLTKNSPETYEIQRKISLKLSRFEKGTSQDYIEESLDVGYISQRLSRSDF